MDFRDLKISLHLAEIRHFVRSRRAMHVRPSTPSPPCLLPSALRALTSVRLPHLPGNTLLTPRHNPRGPPQSAPCRTAPHPPTTLFHPLSPIPASYLDPVHSVHARRLAAVLHYP